MRFEPAGMTDDPDIRIATSLVDYIFRKLAVEYLAVRRAGRDMGVLTVGERTQPTLPGVEEAVDAERAGLRPAPARGPSRRRRRVVDATAVRRHPGHAVHERRRALLRLRRHHAARRAPATPARAAAHERLLVGA